MTIKRPVVSPAQCRAARALLKWTQAKLAQQAAVEAGPVEGEPSEAPAASKPRGEFEERQPRSNQSTILIEGGEDFDEDETEEFDEENEPNFNRAEGAPVPAGAGQLAGGSGGGRPQANNRRRRRRRGGRPGGGGSQG